MPRRVLLLLVPFLVAAGPPVIDPTPHGDRLRDGYFRHQAKQLGDAALAGIASKADWDREAPRLRREFLDMMGLWPLPRRTDFQATVTGNVDTPTYTVEKLHYQSLPGLYVTANLFVPKARKGPCPAVLYVCGHGPMVIDGVTFGNKVTYHHHAAWFAENGYVCLVLDTLQLGEAAGLHHGTSRLGMWWWPALGYTPAGVELWNAMRGLDYLESRPEVDRKRLGVTGRSGGGATSWWVGAADERVKCVVPVAGIADLLAHVSEGYPGELRDGVVAGHCDCMYMVNTYRWDYTTVMALCAPRAVLLGNSDADSIFPVPGYRRMTDKVKKLYATLGVSERFGLLETKGGHKDTVELRLGAYRWMNRWLKDDVTPVTEPERPRLTPQQLKVFARPPADAVNDILHERFRQPAKLDLPESAEVARAWWAGKAPQLKQSLLDRVFRGWPTPPPDLATKPMADVVELGVRLRAFDFVSEERVPLRVFLVEAAKGGKPTEILATVCDEGDWQTWLATLGPAFRDALHAGGNPPPRPYPEWDEAALRQQREVMARYGWAFAIVTPRGVGRTRWSEASPFDGKPVGHQIRRRFHLLGQTLEGQQVWDVRRAVQCLRSVYADTPLTLQGRGDAGVVGLYAALFEPTVTGIELWRPPASHRQGPCLLNVLTVLDVPQAVGLVLPRRVKIDVKAGEAGRWAWAARLARAVGTDRLTVREE